MPEPKPYSIAVFKNEKKKSDKHPAYNVVWTDGDGNKYTGALWVKEYEKEGEIRKYMQGNLKPEDQSYKQNKTEPAEDGGDQLPF